MAHRIRIRRRGRPGGFLASAVAPLLAWSALNSIRYGDFTIVRGRNVFVFSRAFTHHLVAPSNGPSTRALARAVDEHLLPLEPYRSYHVDEKELFASGSFRMLTDLFAQTYLFTLFPTLDEAYGTATYTVGS